VSFLDGAQVLSVKPLDAAGAAIFRTSSLSVGTHVITATYSGDGKFQGSTASLSQVIQHHRNGETEEGEETEEQP
jgi:hypothetical protein